MSDYDRPNPIPQGNTTRSRVLFFLSAFFLSAFCNRGQILPSAWAGREIGNGGHTLVCQRESTSPTYQLYDLFEASEIRLPRLNIIRDSHTPFLDQAERAVERIAAISPLYAQVVREEMQQILAHINFVSSQELTFVPDGGLLARPVNCTVEQLANDTNDPDYRLLISRERFDRLPLTHQAALILHETIYKLDRQIEAIDSVNTRKLIGHLFSTQEIPQHLIKERALFYVGQVIHNGPFVFTRLQKVFQHLSQETSTTLAQTQGKWELWGKAPRGNQGRTLYLYRGRRYTRFFHVETPSPVAVVGHLKITDQVLDEGLNFVDQEILRKQVVQEGRLVIFQGPSPQAGDYLYKCLVHRERPFVGEEDLLFCEQSQWVKSASGPLRAEVLQYIVLNRPADRTVGPLPR